MGGFGEALRDRDAMAEAWHPDSTDDSRAAATAAASLALGHYALALAPAMRLNYAVFLEAHVRSHLRSSGAVLAWQWHLCAAAWLMDQTFASTPRTTVTEHLEGSFSDLDLLATAARMSFFSSLSSPAPKRLSPGAILPGMRMKDDALRAQLDRLMAVVREEVFLAQASAASRGGPGTRRDSAAPSGRRTKSLRHHSPSPQPAASQASVSPTAPGAPTRDEVATDVWARQLEASLSGGSALVDLTTDEPSHPATAPGASAGTGAPQTDPTASPCQTGSDTQASKSARRQSPNALHRRVHPARE